jgi:hypothetical protein
MALPPFVNGFQPFLKNNSDMLLQAGAGLLGGQTAPEQVAGLAQGVAGVRQRNKTLEFLRQQNPELAAAVESGALTGGDAYKLFFQQKLEAEKPKGIMNIGGAGYNQDTGTWITPPANPSADQESFYGNPIPIQTPQGIQYGQIGSKGSFKPIDIGQGNTFAPPVKAVDTGTGTTFVGPGAAQIGAPIPKDLVGAASDTKLGGSQGDARAAYNSMASKMPGLEAVVKDLEGLADKATYTGAGQVLDLGRKQLGMAPRDAAVARAQYISTVDNQVLPLLRDTFGAAFTQREGETLRDTLGDPDKSPQEKKVVLRSFIEQKRRDLEALATQSGRAPAAAPAAGGNTTSTGVPWSMEP